MSAIWGIVSFQNAELNKSSSQNCFLSEYKKKCKLDSYAQIATNHAIFGCGLQFVTAESSNETLPYSDDEEHILFTADCLLDNREEIIALLKEKGLNQFAYSEMGDSMLLYLCYKSFGDKCTQYLRGLYAAALFDEEKKELVLLSDHTASRCLYYYKDERYLFFSTLLAPLKKLVPNLIPNEKYGKDFFLSDPSVVYSFPGETPYENIQLMLPGTYMTFTKDTQKSQRYWSVKKYKSDNPTQVSSPDDFLSLYREVVKNSLRTKDNVALAMSSGLDSASIGALAANLLAEQNKPLYTYTFVPYLQKAKESSSVLCDEAPLAKEIATMYPNMVPSILNNQGKNYFDDLNECLSILEMPYKLGTFANHKEICEHARHAGCKVVLNGAFGNATVSFGHINHILYDLYQKKDYQNLFLSLKQYTDHENLDFQHTLEFFLKSFQNQPATAKKMYSQYYPENPFVTQTVLKDYSIEERFSKDLRHYTEKISMNAVNYMHYLDTDSLLIYLGVFETKFGLHHNLILRDPTKDVRILKYCSLLPFEFFAHSGEPRYLIRYYFADLLPSNILSNWQQHAFLNTDWLDRIQLHWEEIKDTLYAEINAAPLPPYISKEDLLQYISSMNFEDKKCRKIFKHLCAIICFKRFYQL